MALYIFLLPVLAGALFLLRHVLRMRSIQSKLPPGPRGWPLVGNIEIIKSKRMHMDLMELGKKFGGIFATKIGVQCTVWVTSYRLFREATIDHVWDFAGRPPEVAFGDLIPGIIASGVDEDSREVRRWTLVSLRSFGFGKADMQNVILEEVSTVTDNIRQTAGEPFDPRHILANGAANVIAATLLGRTFQHGDAGFTFVHEALTEGLKLVLVNAQYSAFPILKMFPNKRVQRFIDKFRDTKDFLKAVMEEHEPTRHPGNPRDYIDMWLEHAEKSLDKQHPFTKERLQSALIDLFGGGFETTTTSLQWVLIMMLHHPEVQAKVHEELDAAVQKGQTVTLEDRESLPYTEAVVWESARIFTVIPFSVPHRSTEDAFLGGHKIPRNTRVMLHLFSIHHDPDLWESPEEFRPERFVVDGKLRLPDYFVPFSAGRRSCIGEQLARKELFLFFANLMNTFRLENPAGNELPSLRMNDAVVLYPNPFTLVAKER